jgi:mRNA interferase MazF
MADPLRGEVWLADLGATRGHEQAGRRPVLILSVDLFNAGPAQLVIVLPLTSTIRNVPAHIPIHPPEGGLRRPSTILCDAIRSVTRDCLIARW